MKRYDILIVGLCVGFACRLQAKQNDDALISKQARMETKSLLEHQLVGVAEEELTGKAKTVIAHVAEHLQRDITRREFAELLRELYAALRDVPGARRQKLWQQLGSIFPQIVHQVNEVAQPAGDEAAGKKSISSEAAAFIEKLEMYPGKSIEKIREKLQTSVSNGRDAFIAQLDQFLEEETLPADLEAFVFRLKHAGG